MLQLVSGVSVGEWLYIYIYISYICIHEFTGQFIRYTLLIPLFAFKMFLILEMSHSVTSQKTLHSGLVSNWFHEHDNVNFVCCPIGSSH